MTLKLFKRAVSFRGRRSEANALLGGLLGCLVYIVPFYFPLTVVSLLPLRLGSFLSGPLPNIRGRNVNYRG